MNNEYKLTKFVQAAGFKYAPGEHFNETALSVSRTITIYLCARG